MLERLLGYMNALERLVLYCCDRESGVWSGSKEYADAVCCCK